MRTSSLRTVALFVGCGLVLAGIARGRMDPGNEKPGQHSGNSPSHDKQPKDKPADKPGERPTGKPGDKPADKSADPLAKNKRWKGEDKDAKSYLVRVTERSQEKGTATLVFDEDGRGQKFWMEVELKDGKISVVKATRANGNGVKDVDTRPEFKVAISKEDVLTVSGQAHFDAPRAEVNNKVFALNLTCKPVEPAESGKKRGKDKGKKNKNSGDSE